MYCMYLYSCYASIQLIYLFISPLAATQVTAVPSEAHKALQLQEFAEMRDLNKTQMYLSKLAADTMQSEFSQRVKLSSLTS